MKFFCLLFALCWSCLSLYASAAPIPEPVARALRQSGIPAAAFGAIVMSPEGRVLWQHNAATPLNPASVMKVVTTAAALDILGPAYTWRTDVLVTGPIRDGRLAGDLVIRGGGNPRLTMESLWLLLRDVMARGVRHIDGDVVLDRGAFQVDEVDPGQFDGQPTRPYNVGPDALLMHWWSVRLVFVPDTEHRSVAILPEPPLPEVRIVNQLTLGDGPCDAWPDTPEADPANATLTFRGTFAASCGERDRSFVVLPPLGYARSLFDHLWRELGGTRAGNVRYGSTPSMARPLTGADSPTLAEVVRDINKNSNNVMARHLLLTMGASAGQPATLPAGRAAIMRWLAERQGDDAAATVLENGSGLSRIERITPGVLAGVLATAWNGPYGPELASSLPVPGVDGTLKRKYKDAPIAGRAHLKSGYLENVRAIAGYVHGPDGRTLIVVGIVNHDRAREAAAVPEALVQWTLEQTERPLCCGGMQPAAGRRGARPR
ncbi:MAG: D-alanyl-D-alanine carboxypeptidase/D-alanyl-D-alanine-endopeptidase [Burkholderiales bacterium]